MPVNVWVFPRYAKVPVVLPVPPLAIAKVPVSTIAPVVAVLGRSPVVPPEKEDTPAPPTAFITKAVVAICVVLVAGEAVGANGTPVSVGLADKTTEVVPVDVVTPVPPLATFSVPAKVIAPVVAVFGVKPVEPAENVDTPAPDMAFVTNAVVAIWVVLVAGEAVGANGTPVSVGLAKSAFKLRAVWVAVETGLFASLVLSTLPNPTIVLVIPDTVPVKVGDAILAFKLSAVWVAVETGLFASLVLSTLPNPTIVLVMPDTVPVNVGLAKLAFKLSAVWVAVETGLLRSLVLSTLPNPTIVLVMPDTVPVNVGLAKLAFKLRAVWVAVETGLLMSLVLSTLPNPTILLVMPDTVPVKVGEAIGA